MSLNRRRFISQVAATSSLALAGKAVGAHVANSDRVAGMLLGGLIGDALGGPVEFAEPDRVREVLPGVRRWDPARTLTAVQRQRLADSLPLLSYVQLRPEPAPYGPWKAKAPAGTVTDDSRHKIILIRSIRDGLRQGPCPITARTLARGYIEFTPIVGTPPAPPLQQLCDEGMREYVMAARWLHGERDESRALPVGRLWSGIATCSGQMMLPPLAAAYGGRPQAAYRAAYDLDFVDAPLARDFAAALVAGLASVLGAEVDTLSTAARWQHLLAAMRNTDPFRLRDVPFAHRPLHRWLDMADRLARQAEGRPATLFHLLETQGQPVYWWDAHYTLLVPLAMLRFCDFDVRAALHLTLDFGHDTDSYAQVIGCLGGAVCGQQVFGDALCHAVRQSIKSDFGEDIDSWSETLQQYSAAILARSHP